MAFQRGPGEGYHAAKAAVLAICPTAVCRRRFSGSIRGYVVYRTRGGATGIAGAGSAREAWNLALSRLDARKPTRTT
jgi:hypothetical protein